MNNKKLLLAPFGGLAIVVAAMSVAWACTAFLGKFTVSGSSGGRVVTEGLDNDGIHASPKTYTMLQTVSGSTSAAAMGGAIHIHTAASASGQKLPASNSVSVERSTPGAPVLVGDYFVTYFNGVGYASHDQWTVDCMSNPATRAETTGTAKLGEVTINGSGKISAAKNAAGGAVPVTASGNAGPFALPPSMVNTVGESAVCVSNRAAWDGAQAPIAIISI